MMVRDWDDIIRDLKKLDEDLAAHMKRQLHLLYWELVIVTYMFLVCCYLIYLIKGAGIG